MKKILWLSASAVALFAVVGSNPAAADAITTLYGTNAAGAADGTVDAHWTLASVPVGNSTTLYDESGTPSFPGAWFSGPHWVSPDQAISSAVGTYDYQTSFDLTGYNLSTVSITGKWTSDNDASLKINGVIIGANADTGYGSLTSFTIPIADLLAGTNTIDVIVDNEACPACSNNPTGAWVTFDTETAELPEPGTLALIGAGLFGLGYIRRRKTV